MSAGGGAASAGPASATAQAAAGKAHRNEGVI